MLMSNRVWVRLFAASTALVVLCIWFYPLLITTRYKLSESVNTSPIDQAPTETESTPSQLPCQSIPGGNETLVILRTGSTELQDRFPIHTSTTLRCFPNYLVFSDYEEDFLGVHILDALDSVSPDIVANHDDFELYRRLKQHGRTALAPSELSGSSVIVEGASGNAKNPGWKLDKWKFLPMVNRTLFEHPDMKWYVFIEADTFIFWSSLQLYLAATDHTKPLYAGDLINIGEIAFNHGGTGFIVSQPALRTVVEYYIAYKAEIEAVTDAQWAGDSVLGKMFLDSGVPATDIYPLMQGIDPGNVLYARDDDPSIPKEPWQVWCSPPLSYHHLSPTVVEALWNFEQEWLRSREESDILRHKDIFKQYVMPQMATPRTDWDNLSDEEQGDIQSFEECKELCEAKEDCRQYSYDEGGQCKTRINPRLGLARNGTQSGWIEERIRNFEQDMAPCGNKGLERVTPPLQEPAQ